MRLWSTTASGNASVAGINFAEGQSPSTVNNSAREMMAQIRQTYTRQENGWVQHSATASVNSQTVVKLTGNIAAQFPTGTTVRLSGGSARVNRVVVSASYTAETTLTLQTGASLSASMSVVSHMPTYLGTAALVDTGTSGTKIPLLDGDLNFSGSITFTGKPITFSADNTGGAGTAINRLVFTDLDTTTVADQPVGEIRWNISDVTAASALAARLLVNSVGVDGGSYMSFYTSNAGGAATEKARLDNTGNYRLVTTTGGIGYATGAGNTVTQLTSRTTGVTINRPTGGITLFTAAGSTTAATFTVTNSVVENNDVVVLNQNGGTNKYIFLVSNVTNGSFDITFYTTGGTASDAPRINFAIIKGAAT